MGRARGGSLVLVPALALAAALPPAAPRAQAKFAWQKREVVLDYARVRVGTHTLAELAPGEMWRLGADDVTTLRTDAPLLTPDTVIPPGHYRAWIARPDEATLQLQLDGAGRWMAAGGDHVTVEATLTKAAPPSSALEIAFSAATEQKDPELRALACTVTFGEPRLTVPLTIVGSERAKAGKATLDWFKLPAAWLGERLELAQHSPVAELALPSPRKDGTGRLNVLLAEHEVRLVPQETPPAGDGGFAPIADLTGMPGRTGSVAWSAHDVEVAHFTVDRFELVERKRLRIEARVGRRRAVFDLPVDP